MSPRSLLVLLLLAACASDRPAVSANDSTPWRKPGDTIDSILPMPEMLRRFRVGGDSVATLAGGEPSRDALVRRFLRAVSARDTADLAAMAVSRDEFGWLLFPQHIYQRPPYELDPAIFWLQLTNGSTTGIRRVLERQGGRTLTLLSLDCPRDTMQLRAGPGALWGPCALRYRQDDSTITRRLFGSIYERDGRVKFMSYSNDY